MIGQWSRTIPVEDKSQWRDPQVVEAYQQAALAGDPISKNRKPPSMRIPAAYRMESYNLSKGQKYWEAEDITVPTLVMRGELDFWSRPVQMELIICLTIARNEDTIASSRSFCHLSVVTLRKADADV